jgi:hypothetical protein
MPQNRNDLIKRFIGVASNTITHRMLLKSEIDADLREYYNNEASRDKDIALEYRNKINPKVYFLPQKDSEEIKSKIKQRVKLELLKRSEKGYKIRFELLDEEVISFLNENKIC